MQYSTALHVFVLIYIHLESYSCDPHDVMSPNKGTETFKWSQNEVAQLFFLLNNILI